MSSQRTRPTATRADLAARRTAATARRPGTPASGQPGETFPGATAVPAPGQSGAASVPESPRLPRVVPVLTPPPAPSAARPFVVASQAPAAPASTPAPSSPVLMLAPAIRVARVALERYLRSWWLLVDLVGIVVIWAVAFRGQVTPPSFFEAANLGLALLAILGAYGVLVTTPPRVYLRLIPRRDYRAALAGLVLANAVIRTAWALALLGLTLVLRDLTFATAPAVVVGMLGLIAGSVLIGTVSIVLAPPVVSRVWREGVLAAVLLALYSYLDAGPVGRALSVTRVVLLPIAACYDMGQTGELGRWGLLALLIVAALVAGMVWLAAFALTRRHTPVSSARQPASTAPVAGEPRVP